MIIIINPYSKGLGVQANAKIVCPLHLERVTGMCTIKVKYVKLKFNSLKNILIKA